MYLNRERFKNEEKKLKKYHNEQSILEKIILLIKQSNSFEELSKNPLSYIYSLEMLKNDKSGYYSFRLAKSGNIRLIFSIDKMNNIIYLEYISMNHYKDFERKCNK